MGMITALEPAKIDTDLYNHDDDIVVELANRWCAVASRPVPENPNQHWVYKVFYQENPINNGEGYLEVVYKADSRKHEGWICEYQETRVIRQLIIILRKYRRTM